jgi:hypothetical protein
LYNSILPFILTRRKVRNESWEVKEKRVYIGGRRGWLKLEVLICFQVYKNEEKEGKSFERKFLKRRTSYIIYI